MRKKLRKEIEACRHSDIKHGGIFCISIDGVDFAVVAQVHPEGWEHVWVGPLHRKRCPTWEEMVVIKDVFWSEDECVFEFHPPKSEYVNKSPYVLHLWKPVSQEFPLPPKELV